MREIVVKLKPSDRKFAEIFEKADEELIVVSSGNEIFFCFPFFFLGRGFPKKGICLTRSPLGMIFKAFLPWTNGSLDFGNSYLG